MALRLLRGGHRVVAFDPRPEAIAAMTANGAGGASSLENLVGQLSVPRAVWSMVPAGDVTQSQPHYPEAST